MIARLKFPVCLVVDGSSIEGFGFLGFAIPRGRMTSISREGRTMLIDREPERARLPTQPQDAMLRQYVGPAIYKPTRQAME